MTLGQNLTPKDRNLFTDQRVRRSKRIYYCLVDSHNLQHLPLYTFATTHASLVEHKKTMSIYKEDNRLQNYKPATKKISCSSNVL